MLSVYRYLTAQQSRTWHFHVCASQWSTLQHTTTQAVILTFVSPQMQRWRLLVLLTQGLHRSHSNPSDNPTAVIHPCRLLRHKAVRKRGFQHSPVFLLCTPKHVYARTQDGRWTLEIDLTVSALAGSSPAWNKDVHTMSIPLHAAPRFSNLRLLNRTRSSQ